MTTADTSEECLKLLKNTPSITTLDITGGAPELNESFRYLVKMAVFYTLVDRYSDTFIDIPNIFAIFEHDDNLKGLD
jgi:hypothetical protein